MREQRPHRTIYLRRSQLDAGNCAQLRLPSPVTGPDPGEALHPPRCDASGSFCINTSLDNLNESSQVPIHHVGETCYDPNCRSCKKYCLQSTGCYRSRHIHVRQALHDFWASALQWLCRPRQREEYSSSSPRNRSISCRCMTWSRSEDLEILLCTCMLSTSTAGSWDAALHKSSSIEASAMLSLRFALLQCLWKHRFLGNPLTRWYYSYEPDGTTIL